MKTMREFMLELAQFDPNLPVVVIDENGNEYDAFPWIAEDAIAIDGKTYKRIIIG